MEIVASYFNPWPNDLEGAKAISISYHLFLLDNSQLMEVPDGSQVRSNLIAKSPLTTLPLKQAI
jgi:hypothetical protein